MGITIHYRGRIDRIEDVERLSREIEEFAEILEWGVKRWQENWNLPNTASLKKKSDSLQLNGHVPIRGISLFPAPNCEPLCLTFTKEGYLASSMSMVLLADDEIEMDRMWQSTKTQFASVETHISIIKLLKFVKKKYISNLEVHDEGRYWETEDALELQNMFDTIGEAIDSLSDSLNLIPQKELENKTAEEIANFIEDIIRKKFGK